MATAVRSVARWEIDRVQNFYRSSGYGGELTGDELILVAENDECVVGALRISREHGTLVLHGMTVAGGDEVGMDLLRAAERRLRYELCYCLTYQGLLAYYAEVGFEPVPDEEVPPMLRRRMDVIRAQSPGVLAMRRWP